MRCPYLYQLWGLDRSLETHAARGGRSGGRWRVAVEQRTVTRAYVRTLRHELRRSKRCALRCLVDVLPAHNV